MNTRIWIPILVIVGVLLIIAALFAGGRRAIAPVSNTGETPEETATTTTEDGAGGIVAFKSGIRGAVTIGPTCPLTRPGDAACADKPYATTVMVRRAGSTATFATAETDPAGTFQFSLPPGDYVVEAKGGKLLPRCPSANATVGSTGYTLTNIACDSGIR